MVIKALAENTALSKEFKAEHALSLYIETGKHKILFDTGETDVFVHNAKKLGVDLQAVDMVVISHGHIDHGGGLKYFFKLNSKAPVYIHPKAAGKYYSRRPYGSLEPIGLGEEILISERFIYTTERFFIDKGIEVFSNVSGKELPSLSNKALMMEKDGEFIEDTFEHEQNLVITEDGKTALFAGCAHNGIANIKNCFAGIKKRYADFVFGGFHLYNCSAKTSEAPELVKQIGQNLMNDPSKYYTCHCTGMEAYKLLKEIMGEKIEYLAGGSVLEI